MVGYIMWRLKILNNEQSTVEISKHQLVFFLGNNHKNKKLNKKTEQKNRLYLLGTIRKVTPQ